MWALQYAADEPHSLFTHAWILTHIMCILSLFNHMCAHAKKPTIHKKIAHVHVFDRLRMLAPQTGNELQIKKDK